MDNLIFIDDDKIKDWSNEINNHTKEIDRILFIDKDIVDNTINDLFNNHIIPVLSYWIRNTYVGERKNKILQTAFQNFFNSLYELLRKLRGYSNIEIKSFVKKALYKGILYRYLGNLKSDKDIEYNDIWVSWSKKKSNTYFDEKITNGKIIITCKTKDKYGIDLTAFGMSCNNEEEVVYPTIKKTIKNIEQID